jgi:predicted MFS family arabinose efflux permease
MTAAVPPIAGWDGALRARLAVLGFALFVYLTAELFPIGALTELATGLHIRPSTAGLLLTAYAVAAGTATLPAVWLSRQVDRRLALTVSMALLAVSQIGFSLAPGFAVAALSRAVAAVAHGLLWSQVPVVAARYAPSRERGRATAAVFAGSSMGLVAGAPLSTALAHTVGWRWGSAVLAAAAVAATALLRTVLPETPALREARSRQDFAWGPVLIVCLTTIMLVVGHYVSYTYLALLIAPAGLAGRWLALVLAGYGMAGLLGVILAGRRLDTHPRPAGLTVAMTLTVAVGALSLTHIGWVVLVLILAWGAAAAALPVVLQAAVLRAAPDASDTPSGSYVVAYQIGITGGSALGAVVLGHATAAHLPMWSGIALAAGTALVAATPRVFGCP